MIPEPAPTVRELLAFYLEAGVDCTLAEEPIDRLAELDAPLPAPPPAPAGAAPPRAACGGGPPAGRRAGGVARRGRPRARRRDRLGARGRTHRANLGGAARAD